VRVNLELDLVSRLVARRARAARTDLTRVTSALASAGHVSGRAGLDKILSRLAAGDAVAVWDPDAENEGDVIFAGTRLRPEAFRFLLTEVCGHPTVPCAPAVLDRLDIGRYQALATGRAPPSTSRSTWPRVPEPGYRQRNVQPWSGGSRIRRPSRRTS
jgi:hypothetical protein